jgi:phosphoglycerate dehydrogenase-like enzyme
MARVLIAPMSLSHFEGPYLETLRRAGFDPVYPPRPAQMTEEELLRQLAGIPASLAGSEPYTRRVIEANPSLRVIARLGVGYDAVDLAAATEHGVAVTITPGTNQDAVAEHTFALILALAKNVVTHDVATRAGRWPRHTNLPLRGQTLGIAGLGRIGKAVAVRGQAFGMRVLAHEPLPDADFVRRLGITLVSLDRLLAESDYLTLHVPLTAESKHLINRDTLARMKPSAFLVNTARGGLVREPDLVDALRTRQIAGAALDVFDEEPAIEHALFGLENVVLTPHTAGGDLQSRADMALSAAEAIVSLSNGDWPADKVVNPEVRVGFRW